MDADTTRSNLQTIIDALMECENENRKCIKCKHRKKGCLLFLRDSLAVALTFILASLGEPEEPEGLFI